MENFICSRYGERLHILNTENIKIYLHFFPYLLNIWKKMIFFISQGSMCYTLDSSSVLWLPVSLLYWMGRLQHIIMTLIQHKLLTVSSSSKCPPNTDIPRLQYGAVVNNTPCLVKKVPLYFRLWLSHILVDFYNFYTTRNTNEYSIITCNLLT